MSPDLPATSPALQTNPVAPPPRVHSSQFVRTLLWRRRTGVILLILIAALAGAWRYRVTRPNYRYAAGQEAIRERDWKRAEDLADRIQSAGHADLGHLLRAEVYQARQEPDRALSECKQINDQGSIGVRAATLSGRCYLDIGDIHEADQAFSYAVASDPDNVDAHRGLAALAYDLGQIERTIGELKHVVRLDPADVRPHRLLGDIYRDTGRGRQCEAEYREALRLATEPSELRDEILFSLADNLIQQAKYADAVAVLNELRTDSPHATALWIDALRGVGRRKEAVELADRALADHPQGVFYKLRGQLYMDAGNAEAAIPLLEEAARLCRVNREPYEVKFLLAQAYAAAGRKADAERANADAEVIRKYLEGASNLNHIASERPWDPAVRLQLAEIFDRLGEPNLAAMWRKAAAACAQQKR